MTFIIDLIFHLDQYLGLLLEQYGLFVYLILFLVIFMETGLVITPFLPGDSLIFVVGTLAGQGSLNVAWLFFILVAAAIIGDAVNYWLGRHFGFWLARSRWFKPAYLGRTKVFYEKHGKLTIILARFTPIIRTFAPFVAGVGRMNYRQFASYNVVGGLIWVGLFLFGGFFFGQVPIIRDNLTFVIYVIIALSFVPPAWQVIRSHLCYNK